MGLAPADRGRLVRDVTDRVNDCFAHVVIVGLVIEGVKAFVSGYFQLGFIPKALFLERLTNDRENISVFLLLS